MNKMFFLVLSTGILLKLFLFNINSFSNLDDCKMWLDAWYMTPFPGCLGMRLHCTVVNLMLHKVNNLSIVRSAFPLTLDRGAGGYWRTYQAQQLATPESFEANPSLVWEFYSYRREVMHTKVQTHTGAFHWEHDPQTKAGGPCVLLRKL